MFSGTARSAKSPALLPASLIPQAMASGRSCCMKTWFLGSSVKRALDAGAKVGGEQSGGQLGAGITHPSHSGTQACRARPARRALPHWGNLFPIKRLSSACVGRATLPAPTSLISTASEARLGKASASIPPCQGCKQLGTEPQPELRKCSHRVLDGALVPSVPEWAAMSIPPAPDPRSEAQPKRLGQGLKSPIHHL